MGKSMANGHKNMPNISSLSTPDSMDDLVPLATLKKEARKQYYSSYDAIDYNKSRELTHWWFGCFTEATDELHSSRNLGCENIASGNDKFCLEIEQTKDRSGLHEMPLNNIF
ncbi:hypothetical protein HAX54_016304 [Datura stramonium]|uniref:Uncharacterized protein n=1 Tax=Datura stramonium TaxID=4076 RepID=A0ABS8UIL2_DATST|nr:hypothetical protein [Datura stramonium]